MTPMQECIYYAIKKKHCHTVTDIMKIMELSGPNSVHGVLSDLVRQGSIKKSDCPTCHKVGYYE